jgi:hypothetical protein
MRASGTGRRAVAAGLKGLLVLPRLAGVGLKGERAGIEARQFAIGGGEARIVADQAEIEAGGAVAIMTGARLCLPPR